MFRAAQFDKLLDKATSNLRLDTDWPTIIQICDLIRQNDCSPRYAVSSIKKKLYSQNPHQAMFGLLVLESIAKNCGSVVHDEIASKSTCEMLRDLVKTTQHENLRNKTLELIQAWAFAFRNTPKYRAVQDTMNIMKADGYKFPPLKESDAMFSAHAAPEWSDGDVCHRCRTTFSLMIRKHHCRACGQVFCQQCSGKTSTIPKFGIEKEVRVCDACYDKVSRPPPSNSFKTDSIDTASDYGPALQPQKRPPGGKTQEELQEEEELQLALALSQSEAEQKEKDKKKPISSAPPPSTHHSLSPVPSSVTASPEHGASGASNELSRYLDRGYWEQRRDTAPAASTYSMQHDHMPEKAVTYSASSKSLVPNQEEGADMELEDFVAALRSQIEIFVNRMKSDSSRGRSIANDTSVQTLFMNITAMHSRLLRYIQQQDDNRVHFESLQDKVSQTRDSRAALDTLREEHAARLAAAAEAAERQRQLQMAHKLHTMRKKKHEYLQYQRQLALQRVQEQEREMQIRQEQQKQQYLMGGPSFFIQNPPMQFQNNFPHQAMYANQQFHQGIPTDQSGQPLQQMPQQPMAQPSMIMVQPMQGMARPGNPNQPQLTPMMMQMRMAMPIHPGNLPGQPGAPPQSPSMKQPTSQPNQINPQMSIGQPMPQNPGAPIQMNVRAPGLPPGHPMQVGPQGQPNVNQPQMQIPNQMQVSHAQGPMGLQNQMQSQVPGSIPNQIQHRQNSVANQMQPQAPPMQHQLTQPQQMPQPMGNQPLKIAGQQQQMPQHMGGQPQQMGGQPQQMGSQPQQMGGQPQQMGSQPQQLGGQPQQIGGQPQQMGGQPQQMSGQPQQMGGQPHLVSQPQQPVHQQAPRAPPPNQGQPGLPGPPGNQPPPNAFPSPPQQQAPTPTGTPAAPETEKTPGPELISFD